MLTFYRIPGDSPNMRKVALMLAETALPHTVQLVERESDGRLVEAFRRINPNATVPAITDPDTGVTLFESAAILHYLAEKRGQLLPAAQPARAEAMKWLMFEAANVGPVMGEVYHYLLTDTGELPAEVLQRYKNKLAQFGAILDQQLTGRDFLCGEYSVADIALYPWSLIWEDMADVSLSTYPQLQRWMTTISMRPAVRSAW
jgi:GST-like protein